MLRVGSYDSLDALDQVRGHAVPNGTGAERRAPHGSAGSTGRRPRCLGSSPPRTHLPCPPVSPQYDSRYGGSVHGRRSVEGEACQLAGHLDPVPEEAPPRPAP